MLRHRLTSALACGVLACLPALWLGGCSDSLSGRGHGASSTLAGILAHNDLGQVVFDLYRDSVAAEPAGAGRDAALAELDRQHDEFVAAINAILNNGTLSNTTQTIDALYALVDDGTLPTVSEHGADALALLVADPQALDAIVALARTAPSPAAIPTDELLQLLGRGLSFGETEDLGLAIAELIRENDGRDDNGQPNGEPTLVVDLLRMASDALRNGAAPAAQPGAPSTLRRLLATEATIRGSAVLGGPEWVVRVDDRGAPRVATDPATGRLYLPFRDHDNDGLADLDGQGRFVDSGGAAIDRPTFGEPGSAGFDSDGRAAVAGSPVYVYVDAKRTVLALQLQLLGEVVARDLQHDARLVAEVGLGAAQGAGYDPHGPLVGLAWGAAELLEPAAAPRALRGLAELLRRDPALAERLLVAMSRGLQASGQAASQSSFAGSGLSDPRVQQLLDDMLPLMDDVFDTANQTSTGGVIETLADLRTAAPDFAHQLAPLFRHVTVEREQSADGDRNDVDESRSAPVDRAQPAWIGASDNRSAIHQLLDMLATADGCSVPLLNRSLAVMIVDLMADQSPATIELLIPLLTSMPGFLPNLFCPGISADLQSLDALARSGALDALLPLARVFKSRGQVKLLVSLLGRLQSDYDRLMRPLEGDLALQLESDAFDAALEVIDLGRRAHDPVSGQTVTDALVDLLGATIDDDSRVVDARGATVSSRAHLLLQPLKELDRRLDAAGLGGALGRLSDGLCGVLLERVVVNGVEQLRNGSLVAVAAELLDAAASALPADPADRRRAVTDGQQALQDAVAAPEAITIVTLLRTIDESPSRALFNRSVVNLCTPQAARADDVFGSVARLGVLLLEDPPNLGAAQGAASGLAPFLAQILDPSYPLALGVIPSLERLLSADQGRTVLSVLRAATTPAPGQREAPGAILAGIAQAVADAGGTGPATLDRPALEAALREVVEFVRDDQSGLRWIYQLIRERRL